MCGDEIQCTYAKKIKFCTLCEVYEIYNRSRGNWGKEIKKIFSAEEEKYYNKMLKFSNDKALSEINIKSKKEYSNTHHLT